MGIVVPKIHLISEHSNESAETPEEVCPAMPGLADVYSVVMGFASRGPVFVNDLALDLATLKPLPIKFQHGGALRPVVVLGQVEQLAANLQGRQAEEIAGGCDGQLLERALQADDSVLEDVVGLLPAMDLRITLDHFARQAAQPFAGTVE